MKDKEWLDKLHLKHKCDKCVHCGFETNTCRIEVVMPTRQGTIYKVKDNPTPNVCPTSLHMNMIPIGVFTQQQQLDHESADLGKGE